MRGLSQEKYQYGMKVNEMDRTYPVRRLGNFDEGNLNPAADKIESSSSVEAQEWIRWVHKPLFLVRLQRQHSKPQIKGSQSDSQQRVGGAGLSLWASHGTQALLVNSFCNEQRGQGDEGQWGEDVEVQRQVGNVKVPRLRTIEGRTATRGPAEDIVLDKVPWGKREVAVSITVDQKYRDL